jgi:hypothetical protein
LRVSPELRGWQGLLAVNLDRKIDRARFDGRPPREAFADGPNKEQAPIQVRTYFVKSDDDSYRAALQLIELDRQRYVDKNWRMRRTRAASRTGRPAASGAEIGRQILDDLRLLLRRHAQTIAHHLVDGGAPAGTVEARLRQHHAEIMAGRAFVRDHLAIGPGRQIGRLRERLTSRRKCGDQGSG